MSDRRSQEVREPGERRPRRFLGRAAVVTLGALATVVIGVLLLAKPLHLHPIDRWLGGEDARNESAGPSHKQLWTCGMHPQVLQEEPGDCPICHMKLVPLAVETTGAEASGLQSSGERKILFYRNPMDPSLTSPEPRKDEMGMDYVPVYEDESIALHGDPASMRAPAVTIDPAVVQNMNVTTTTIHRRDVRRQIRTVGYLDYDQEQMVSVTTKFTGYVEKVHVNYLGQPVRKGDPLFEIYSPELVQTEQELLSAIEYVAALENAPDEARKRAQSLLEAARTRLRYWDISAEQIARLEQTREAFRTMTMVAPASGVVMKREQGLEGMAVKPGMDVIHIVDISSLWLTVEVFDDQLPWVQTDGEASISLTYFPGETFRGRVRYIEPRVAEKTRSVRLTLEAPNPDGKLRAGMYATVEFDPVVAANALAVPTQAVIRTGRRTLVIVDLGGGRFAPREVVLGPEGDDFVVAISGLTDGERVVTSAQFLIDSESNLQAAIQKMIAERSHEK